MSDLRELLQKATAAPWRRAEPGPIEGSHREGGPHDHGWERHRCFDIVWDGARDKWAEDAPFPVVAAWGYDASGVRATDPDIDLIVALRNAAPYLLDVVDATRPVMAEWDHYGPTGTGSTLRSHRALRRALAELDRHPEGDTDD